MNVLVGVSGGIAAYKAADLVSNLVKRHSVRVVMTPSATAFVGPLTFEALSGHPVMVDVLATGGAPDGASAVEHISWAKWADIAVIAPLTASTLGKIASGIADNALLTVWLAPTAVGSAAVVPRHEHKDVGASRCPIQSVPCRGFRHFPDGRTHGKASCLWGCRGRGAGGGRGYCHRDRSRRH
jgi:phosphopantothenoylcysteine decarboxylase/phosphopantothenate--cysteine ligase